METRGEASAAVAAHSFYISSPYLGLQKEREQAKQLITRRYHAYRDSYGGSTEPVVETCQADVRRSDHYILILGERYGSRRPEHGGKSVTELEFEAAMESGRSPHAFFLNFVTDSRNGIERDPEAIQALESFRKRVREHCIPLDCQDMPDGRTGWEVFVEGITSLAASPPPRPGDKATPPASRTYTPADLDTWVKANGKPLEQAFLAIPTVQQRRVHVPLDVRLTPAGAEAPSEPMLLQPEHLEPVLADASAHVLLISADGGAGKTSLAFRIARWLMEGKPAGVQRLPVLIETALAENETVADRVSNWLEGQLEGDSGGIDPALVEALLRFKRLIPILDHVSELPEEARRRLLRNLPAGLVIATSRSVDDGYRERPLSRIEPLQIATDRLQSFFLDYLRQQGQGEALKDDDLVPAQNQLRRIVGDKPITALLAQMFIDDVIAKRRQGLLAGSVPELMLSYVARVDTPADPGMRQRAGMVIDGPLVQRALKALALASHRQGAGGRPLFQPVEFPRWLAERALAAADGMALEQADQRGALLGYLIDLNLLRTPGADRSWLRFPLDPLADYLAALRQLERLEVDAAGDGTVWQGFLAELELRTVEERERMRGFLLALRDCCSEQGKSRALAMPADAPDRLGRLGFLDPEEERYRLALQRARKWMWELGVPVASERRDAIAKLAAMAAPGADAGEQRAVRTVASERLALAMWDEALPIEERSEAATVLGLIGGEVSVAALEQVMGEEAQPVALRRAAAEALGLSAAGEGQSQQNREQITAALKRQLPRQPLELVVQEASDWERIDAVLPLLQGAARGLQLAASRDLPLLGSGAGRAVPMLTLSALNQAGAEALEVRTEVLEEVPVWRLPLPQGQQLEMVVVPGGKYTIGSPESEAGREIYPRFRQRCEGVNVEAERTVHLEPYAMARFPISQAQWAAVAALPRIEREIAVHPGTYETRGLWERFAQPAGLAVDSVSWFDCGEWLARLNLWLKEEWTALGGGTAAPQLALPSESQWEVACRAGTSTPFHGGDTLDPSWANYDANYTYGRGRKGKYRQRPTATGALAVVNRWGLAELHGQLLEWCGDRWHRDPVGPGWPQDGSAWEEPDAALEGFQDQEYRLLRGGSWFSGPLFCRAAYRGSDLPGYTVTGIGVRPCCLLPPGSLLGS
jgi:formylglycine-generating enzyme required for sulfatase activity